MYSSPYLTCSIIYLSVYVYIFVFTYLYVFLSASMLLFSQRSRAPTAPSSAAPNRGPSAPHSEIMTGLSCTCLALLACMFFCWNEHSIWRCNFRVFFLVSPLKLPVKAGDAKVEFEQKPFHANTYCIIPQSPPPFPC